MGRDISAASFASLRCFRTELTAETVLHRRDAKDTARLGATKRFVSSPLTVVFSEEFEDEGETKKSSRRQETDR